MDPEKTMPNYIGPEISDSASKMSRGEIKNRFDAEVASLYSQRKHAWLPEFEYAFNLIPSLLKRVGLKRGKILDIGAGTGNLSRTVLESIPDVTVTLLDFSHNMLSEAPTVLSGFDGRYDLQTGDFLEAPFPSAVFSAVISSFSIHHCRGESEYLQLYEKIFNTLAPSGIFACCDVVAGSNEHLSEMNEAEWRYFLTGQGFLSTDVEKILSNYHREDSPLSIPAHIDLLRKAGFTAADVIWKRANFAVYAAIKR